MTVTMRRIQLSCTFLLFAVAAAAADADWKPLFNAKNLDGWEPRGACAWTVMPEGVLVGQRIHTKPTETWPLEQKDYNKWLYRQAWLYTTRDFGQFDLHLEYWIPKGGNSGVSLRDHSRAHYAIGEPDSVHPELAGPLKSTPAHIGYEIQILDGDSDKYPSGSIYTFVAAKRGVHRSGAWNTMDIEVRDNMIRVRLNGGLVAESPGNPARPKTGPIGLQLHDQFTFALFRNIRIREVH